MGSPSHGEEGTGLQMRKHGETSEGHRTLRAGDRSHRARTLWDLGSRDPGQGLGRGGGAPSGLLGAAVQILGWPGTQGKCKREDGGGEGAEHRTGERDRRSGCRGHGLLSLQDTLLRSRSP